MRTHIAEKRPTNLVVRLTKRLFRPTSNIRVILELLSVKSLPNFQSDSKIVEPTQTGFIISSRQDTNSSNISRGAIEVLKIPR